MEVTIMRRVVPMVGVFAMLLALLVPQATAFAADTDDDATDGAASEEDDPSTRSDDVVVGSDDEEATEGDETTENEEVVEEEGADSEGAPFADDGPPAVDDDRVIDEARDDNATQQVVARTTTEEGSTAEQGPLPQCERGEASVTIVDVAGAFDNFRVKATTATPADGCFVYLESYLVPNSFASGQGFGSTAVDQESYERVIHHVLPGADDDVVVEIPACGSYQVDAYGGNGGEVKDIVDIGGHHTGGYFLYNNAGKVYYQDSCDVDLALAHWCAFDDGVASEYIFRLDRRDTNEAVPSVAYRAFAEAGTFEELTGELGIGEEVFFTATDRSALLKVEWGEGIGGSTVLNLNGVTEGSDGNNGANDKPCGIWVTPEKQWDNLDGDGPDVNLTLTYTGDEVSGPWGQAHTNGDQSVNSGQLVGQSAGIGSAIFVPFNQTYSVTENTGPWSDVSEGGAFSGLSGSDDFIVDLASVGIEQGDWKAIATAKSPARIHTVTNELLDPQFRFQKLLCDDFPDISGNRGTGGTDATDGGFQRWGSTTPNLPITVYEQAPENCRFADEFVDFEFQFGSSITSNADALSHSSYTFNAELGLSTISASDLLGEDGLLRLMSNHRLAVAEVVPDDTSFGAVQCFDDARNPDNLEYLDNIGNKAPQRIDCVAWNIDEHPEVTIEKVVEGDVAEGTEFEVCVGSFRLEQASREFSGVALQEVENGFDQPFPVLGEGPCVTFVMTDDGPVATGTDATFRLPSGSYFVVETREGGADSVAYAVNGEETEQSPDEGGVYLWLERGTSTTVTVTNTFDEDTTPVRPSTPDDVEVIAPDASIGSACVEDADDRLVTITLDNTASEVEVEYTLIVGGVSTTVVIDGGEQRVFEELITPERGDVTITVIYGDERIEETVNAEACLTVVEEDVVDRDDDTTDDTDGPGDTDDTGTSDDTDDLQVLGVTQSRLPQTGAPAILLALVGLLSIAVGGGVLRTRGRTQG